MSGQLMTNRRQEKGPEPLRLRPGKAWLLYLLAADQFHSGLFAAQAGMFADLRLAPKAAIARRPSPSNIAVLGSGVITGVSTGSIT